MSCFFAGAKANVSHALNLIRRRFPLNDYPHVTLQQINLVNPINTIPLNQACQVSHLSLFQLHTSILSLTNGNVLVFTP